MSGHSCTVGRIGGTAHVGGKGLPPHHERCSHPELPHTNTQPSSPCSLAATRSRWTAGTTACRNKTRVVQSGDTHAADTAYGNARHDKPGDRTNKNRWVRPSASTANDGYTTNELPSLRCQRKIVRSCGTSPRCARQNSSSPMHVDDRDNATRYSRKPSRIKMPPRCNPWRGCFIRTA